MRWLAILFLGLSVGRVAAQDASNGPSFPEPPATYLLAPDGRITIRAIKLTEPLKLDGLLDESVYADNIPASNFIQQEPNEGQPATERTESWVMFDADHVYVAFRCFDSHPERMVVNEMRRDSF